MIRKIAYNVPMPYLATILSIVLIAANSWHVITQWFINKPHEVFTGIAHYYADYFLYISQIVKAGHMYTNENITPHGFTGFTIHSVFSGVIRLPYTTRALSYSPA